MLDADRKDDGFAGFKPLLRGLMVVLLVVAPVAATCYFFHGDLGELRQTVHELLVSIHAAND